MPNFRRRLAITVVSTMVATAAGSIAGYVAARAFAERATEAKLDQYASRLVADGEASSAELRTVLAAVGASQYPACSGDEIRYFRALIFESEFLKDAGRMHNGRIACSAALGRPVEPIREMEPDFTQQDGSELYLDMKPYGSPSLTVLTVALGDSYVVFTPLTRMHLAPAPLHYVETAMDSPTQRPGRLLGEAPQPIVPMAREDGETRAGNTVYVTRCSIRFFNCVTAYASIADVVRENRGRYLGCIALCGGLGGVGGLALSLFYRRTKSQEQQLRRAIRAGRLGVVYQPIVDMKSGSIEGAEALARWSDEEGRAVGPDVFVRIAEDRGFVGEITRLVLRRALKDFGETLRSRADFRLSVNVAAADLSDPGFVPMVEAALRESAVPAQSLAIEITEGSTARHEAAIKTILDLRRHGHSVHIDDFGTGYSSLAYLHELSVDAIKVDRAFTKAIGTGAVIVSILPQILAMAEALNLEVIVEGVETREQAEYFAGTGRPIRAQGWLFGKPMGAAEFLRLLAGQVGKQLVAATAA